MSTRPTATPRTDAAVIASGFQAVPFGFQDFACQLETELAAAKAECEGLRADGAASAFIDMSVRASNAETELACLRAEVERLKDHAFDKDGTPWKTVCGWWAKKYDAVENSKAIAIARAERAEAEVERLKGALALGQENCEAIYNEMREQRTELTALLSRAEAKVDRLLDENVTLNGYADMHMKEKARAERAEADAARLDWLERNGRFGYKAGTVWSDYFAIDLSGGEKTTLRAAIDAAMKEGMK